MAADKKPAAADANKPGTSGKEPSKQPPSGTAPSTSKDAQKEAPVKAADKKTTDVEDLVKKNWLKIKFYYYFFIQFIIFIILE